ncbi:DUF1289 domain-containing protein [Methylocystis sp. Sn-Cys]|uniref:DUF1289 domain-containing protein n=1 Tax=Methylocystis sp. Sn-Cys TaxID=1701263 RepID=UPI00192219D3|nr:DUF1289 domain-containing protein [Methylocystis sp. Sn-Cys]MBL1255345.1 DUF1289 domain-containing protein [Methylocystis sp. Sn-Cys]
MIPSPCNKICTLNSANVCIGCGRTREEIGSWSQLADAEKSRVAERAKARLDSMGGPKAPVKTKT